MAGIRTVVLDVGDVLLIPHSQADSFARWALQVGIKAPELEGLLWDGPDIEAASIGTISAEEYCRRRARRLRCEEAVVLPMIEDAFSGRCLGVARSSCARVGRRNETPSSRAARVAGVSDGATT